MAKEFLKIAAVLVAIACLVLGFITLLSNSRFMDFDLMLMDKYRVRYVSACVAVNTAAFRQVVTDDDLARLMEEHTDRCTTRFRLDVHEIVERSEDNLKALAKEIYNNREQDFRASLYKCTNAKLDRDRAADRVPARDFHAEYFMKLWEECYHEVANTALPANGTDKPR